jgi:hypothetical protein
VIQSTLSEPSAPPMDMDDDIHLEVNVMDEGDNLTPQTVAEAKLVAEVQCNILHVNDAAPVIDDVGLPRQETEADKEAIKYGLAKETIYAMSCLYHQVTRTPICSHFR